MPEHICEICNQSFKQKGHLLNHLNRKNPCSKVVAVEDPSINIVKPCIKWVGGKTQIIEDVLKLFPENITNYYEPFLGGGSVLLAVLSYQKAGIIKIKRKIYASDINCNIIYLYKNIQSNVEKLITEIKLHTDYSEKHYYELRSEFNTIKPSERNSVRASALFVILNKTCFRGLYREGPNGFNVPFGNYKNPVIIDEDHMRELSAIIKKVVFIIGEFKPQLANIKSGDFVYLDPPYAPTNATSFVKYNKSGFTVEDNKELFNICHNIAKMKNSGFLMSNSYVPFVYNEFDNKEEYIIETISCRRAINSKNPASRADEVLIFNPLS